MTCIINPEQIEKWPLGKHVGVTSKLLVDGEKMTVLWSEWLPGASAPEHIHPHEQVGVVLAGEIIITVNGVDSTAKAGEFYYIPGGAPHAERNDAAVTAVLTDFFSPPREDILKRQFDPTLTGK